MNNQTIFVHTINGLIKELRNKKTPPIEFAIYENNKPLRDAMEGLGIKYKITKRRQEIIWIKIRV